jgi:amino acid adenylation domain-containing protein
MISSIVKTSTLIDLLRWRALNQPELVAYTFLTDGETEEERLTYSELDAHARAIGAWLQSQNAENERVLLLYPPGLSYIAAFFGCLYAGATAVPAYPPRLNHSLQRIQSIISDAGAKFALTNEPILSKVEKMFEMAPFLKRLRWLETDQVVREAGLSDDWREPSLSSDTIAFLQYTSGSTATPKGVMISHGNLLHNERMIQQACEHTEESTFGGWLPLYHDMGLIGNLLQPLFIGSRCILMSPIAFLQKPLRWLQAISRYRVATSGGPNFAYDLCVRKISAEERATLDLSSWTTAFNGAEPVRYETMQRFAVTFASCGFREEAFYPCYGLAEATLMVTGGYKSALPVTCRVERNALAQNQIIEAAVESEKTKTLVGTGRALLDEVIVIANPETLTQCESGEIGEIWVAGENVAAGYWNRPEETEQTFHAYLDSDEGPFLRTGDLGFLKDGELFVTGRLKDLIIIRGQNHYPQDIELSAERSHMALRPGCSAAFSADVNGEERLVVVQELESHYAGDLAEVFEAIRQAVAIEHEVEPYSLVLVKHGSILKTSSGKIQRRACRAAFLDGSLATVGKWCAADSLKTSEPVASNVTAAPRNVADIEAVLAVELAAKLGISLEQVDLRRPVAQFGLDSLLAAELAQSIETKLGMVLPVTSFLQDHSISELAQQLADSRDSHSTASTGEKHSEVSTDYPLSSNQEALWFLHQLAPESTAYSIVRAARIRSPLNVNALRRAAQALVNRHPALRTTFHVADGRPIQRVHRDREVRFEEIDAAEWSEDQLRIQLLADAQLPFDLVHGPLLRVRLFSCADGEHVLLLAVHHIVTDLWSMAVLMRELGVFYEAELTGSGASLPTLKVDYSDHVSWQSELLSGDRGEKLASSWEKQLAGDLSPLELPADRPRPPVQTYRGSSYSFTLNGIKELAREDATLYMTLLAVFQTLLYRYTGQEEFLIGSPAAGRNRPQFSGVIGYFVNPIVLRANCAGDPTFTEFLARVRQTVLGALDHQDYPFPLLVERLQPKRDVSRSPLFQTMFVLQKAHVPGEEALAMFALDDGRARLRLNSLELESIKLEQQVAQFDLTLIMTEADGELHGSFEYNTDLFEEPTIARLAQHFAVLLEGVVANPDQRLATYSLLSRSEQHQVSTEWNQTSRNYERSQCLHELFEEQVKRTPEAVALTFEDESLTYRELNCRANRLAHYLRELGIGPDVLVGVLLERSIEMVVSLLGILKAGGAYVPLDPSYPAERLAFMIADSQVPVLLTQRRYKQSLRTSAQVICFEDVADVLASCNDADPDPVVHGENLAYVIYTSGSTGRPKGAMNSHRAIANRLLWMQEQYQLTRADRVLQKTPFSFDVSVWEFFWPLITGAGLVMARPGGHQDSAYLAEIIQREQISTLHFVPSMLQVFLDEPQLERLTSLRRVICSGEALSRELQQRFHTRLQAELHNLYGPTEAAVDVTAWAVEPDSERRNIPIGKPIANTQIYILDQQQRLAPLGVSGELYIGGVGVGRGYLHRPELTAERFVPNPYATAAGERLYRTGDLARWLPCGNIEYQGRLDHQVKIRGVRIELGEIEAALLQHEAVREVVVSARDDQGEKKLVAYLVTKPIKSAELRSFLKERVPDYLVPSAFVFLSSLPLLPNGKIDRRALPAPDNNRPELDTLQAGPANRLEHAIAEIWQQVLKLKQVGVNDNFFDLGGHSLLMAQVHRRLREELRVDVPMIELLKYPTVSSLSRRLDGNETNSPDNGTAVLEKLTAGQLRLKQLRSVNRVSTVTR